MKKTIFALTVFSAACLFLLLTSDSAKAGTVNAPKADFYVTNGPVWASALSADGRTLYLGGNFTAVGPEMGDGAAIDRDTGVVFNNHPLVNNMVLSAVSDGSGGWYIGGNFTRIGSYTRNRLAHILSDGSVDPVWDPGADGMVYALAVSGSTVYVGGWGITNIGGQARNNLAALDAATGLATAWNPNVSTGVNDYVGALAVSGSTVYVGGTFTSIGGKDRNNLAALDVTTGTSTSWNPDLSAGYIAALAVSGSTVYAGGIFSSVGGKARNNLAALDVTTGTSTSWNPNVSNGVNDFVYTLAVSSSIIYVGGSFSSIGGKDRNGLAAIGLTTGTSTSWNPDLNLGGSIYSMSVSGSTVYVGGSGITNIGGQARNNLAALNAATGLATAWNPDAGGDVYALAVNGSAIYAGGVLSFFGGQTRNHLAAIDTATGLPTAWNPNADNSISSLAVSDSTVYAGGYFSSIGGQARNRLAALDSVSGLATAWNPNPNAEVYDLAVSGSTIYVGGVFSSIGGKTRNRLAAIDMTTGTSTSWNPDFGTSGSDYVYTLAVSSSTIYAGGDFTTVGGQARNNLAALDMTTGLPTAWDPNADDWVVNLAVSGSTVYVGGWFTTVGGQSRSHIAALDPATGLATPWNPDAFNIGDPNGMVVALAPSGSTVYVGGGFQNIGGQARNTLAALDVATGLATGWNPDLNVQVNNLAIGNSAVYAGGYFLTVGGQSRHFIGAFARTYTLAYSAGAHGSVSGSSTQEVVYGDSGTAVTAAPASGYRFASWSDGSTANPRTDASVTGDVSVIASFEIIPSSPSQASSGGSSYQPPPAVGSGAESKTLGIGQTGNIGEVPAAGLNCLTYVNSTADFSVPISGTTGGRSESHQLTIDSLDIAAQTVQFTIYSIPQTLNLKLGQTVLVDLNNDKINDLEVKFASLVVNRVELTIKSLLNAKEAKAEAPATSTSIAIPVISTATTTPKSVLPGKQFLFKRDLSTGSIGADVKELQKYLNARGFLLAKSGPGSPGRETTKFGALTRAAVIKFQKAKNIKPAAGYFGPVTRKAVNGK